MKKSISSESTGHEPGQLIKNLTAIVSCLNLLVQVAKLALSIFGPKQLAALLTYFFNP